MYHTVASVPWPFVVYIVNHAYDGMCSSGYARLGEDMGVTIATNPLKCMDWQTSKHQIDSVESRLHKGRVTHRIPDEWD